MTSEYGDMDLVALVLRGERARFAELVERHSARVFQIVSRYVPRGDVEEVAQEAFIKAYVDLKTFRGQAPFEHWLSRLAVRRCYDYWRTIRRRKEILSPLPDTSAWLEALGGSIESEAKLSAARGLLNAALQQMSAKERIVLQLVHLEERTVKEAAETLGWSTVAVKVCAFRARKKLGVILKSRGEA